MKTDAQMVRKLAERIIGSAPSNAAGEPSNRDPPEYAYTLARFALDALAVIEPVMELYTSGYDGPMMGERIEPLFRALATYSTRWPEGK